MDERIPWEVTEWIVARLNDTITEEESEKLECWIRNSDHHKALFEKIIEKQGFENFCLQAEEHDYRKHYDLFYAHVRKTNRKRRIRQWTYAAIMLLPLSIAIWYFIKQEKTVVYTQNEQIVPGEYRAVLTLTGGETITLSGQSESKLEHTEAFVCGDTLNYEKAVSSEEEKYHRINIPRGGEYILKLSDGTRIWLNSESELKYPEVFTGPERRIFMRGEAYFEVAHDSLHPFIVETEQQVLTVMGTSFNLRAYTDEKKVLTTLETGKVNIRAGEQEVILTPGNQSVCMAGQLRVEKVNPSLYTAWHKGLFIFEAQPLGDILHTLSRWYNIEVFYADPEVEKIRFTGELWRDNDVRELLTKFELLQKVRFDIKGCAVTVSRY